LFHFKPFGRFLQRYPLTDRVTFSFDAPSAILAGAFNGLAITFTGIIGRKIGMDSYMLALMSISIFVGLFLSVWVGHLSEKGDKAAWVFWPGVISRGVVALGGLIVNPVLFLVVMCVYYIVSTFPGPAYSSIMRSNYSDRHRGAIMGSIRIIIQLTSAVTAGFAGWFMEANSAGYQILLPLAACFGIASSLSFRRVKVRKASPSVEGELHQPSFRQSLREIAKDRWFLLFCGVFFVIGFPDKLIIPLEPIRFVDELNMSYGIAGVVQGTIPLLGSILGYFLCVRFSHRFSPLPLLVVTVLLASTRFLNIAVADNPYQLIPGAFLNGMALAGWDLLSLFALFLFASPEKVSLYLGFHGTLVGVRGVLGPILGTWFYEGLHWSIVSIYWIAFWLEIAGVIMLLAFWYYFSKRQKAHDQPRP